MLKDNYVRSAEVIRVIDGDTLEVIVDSGFKYYTVERVQVAGIKTDDIIGENKTDRGLLAKEFVEEMLVEGSFITIQSKEIDGFGRWVCDVYYHDDLASQVNLAQLLLDKDLVNKVD